PRGRGCQRWMPRRASRLSRLAFGRPARFLGAVSLGSASRFAAAARGFGFPHDVGGAEPHQPRIVLETGETGAATAAQQPAHHPSAMIMVDLQPAARFVLADGAAAFLLLEHPIVFLDGDSIEELEAGCPLAFRADLAVFRVAGVPQPLLGIDLLFVGPSPSCGGSPLAFAAVRIVGTAAPPPIILTVRHVGRWGD